MQRPLRVFESLTITGHRRTEFRDVSDDSQDQVCFAELCSLLLYTQSCVLAHEPVTRGRRTQSAHKRPLLKTHSAKAIKKAHASPATMEDAADITCGHVVIQNV